MPEDPEAAIAAAASLLGASRSAVVAGLGTDIAGAEAAIGLARRIGAAFDHMAGETALRDLDVMREAGWLVTTPLQARARADVVLLVGAGLAAAWPDHAARLGLGAPPPLAPGNGRRVLQLCPGADPAPVAGAVRVEGGAEDVPVLLGVLRALLAGRPVAGPVPPELVSVAATLKEARFGVALWSAASLDPLAIEMLCGLVDDLNATTRFAGLPLPGTGNVAGVAQAGGWCCGFPLRTGFGRGAPEHDPWRFDAARLVASGEADAVLWISAFEAMAPPWTRRLPTVALVAPGTAFPIPPEVVFEVGCPGMDHDAVLHDPALGTLAARAPVRPNGAPCVADVLGRIAAALPC